MKLITAIINCDDAGSVVQNLSKGGFSSARLATTGGFLLAGSVTLLIGVGGATLSVADVERFERL